MNQLAQEKEESNFDWFKLQNNNLENKKTNNKEVYLSFLLVFLSIQATLTMNNVFETKNGILTGRYFDICYIKECQIKSGSYIPFNTIKLK